MCCYEFCVRVCARARVCVGLFLHISESVSLLDFYQFAKKFNH